MIAMKIFEQLKTLDTKLTLSKFSTDYLGKSRNYIFVKKHRDEDISNDALLNLYGALRATQKIYVQIMADSNCGEFTNSYYRRCSERNKRLIEAVWNELNLRSESVS